MTSIFSTSMIRVPSTSSRTFVLVTSLVLHMIDSRFLLNSTYSISDKYRFLGYTVVYADESHDVVSDSIDSSKADAFRLLINSRNSNHKVKNTSRIYENLLYSLTHQKMFLCMSICSSFTVVSTYKVLWL